MSTLAATRLGAIYSTHSTGASSTRSLPTPDHARFSHHRVRSSSISLCLVSLLRIWARSPFFYSLSLSPAALVALRVPLSPSLSLSASRARVHAFLFYVEIKSNYFSFSRVRERFFSVYTLCRSFDALSFSPLALFHNMRFSVPTSARPSLSLSHCFFLIAVSALPLTRRAQRSFLVARRWFRPTYPNYDQRP